MHRPAGDNPLNNLLCPQPPSTHGVPARTKLPAASPQLMRGPRVTFSFPSKVHSQGLRLVCVIWTLSSENATFLMLEQSFTVIASERHSQLWICSSVSQ